MALQLRTYPAAPALPTQLGALLLAGRLGKCLTTDFYFGGTDLFAHVAAVLLVAAMSGAAAFTVLSTDDVSKVYLEEPREQVSTSTAQFESSRLLMASKSAISFVAYIARVAVSVVVARSCPRVAVGSTTVTVQRAGLSV